MFERIKRIFRRDPTLHEILRSSEHPHLQSVAAIHDFLLKTLGEAPAKEYIGQKAAELLKEIREAGERRVPADAKFSFNEGIDKELFLEYIRAFKQLDDIAKDYSELVQSINEIRTRIDALHSLKGAFIYTARGPEGITEARRELIDDVEKSTRDSLNELRSVAGKAKVIEMNFYKKLVDLAKKHKKILDEIHRKLSQ